MDEACKKINLTQHSQLYGHICDSFKLLKTPKNVYLTMSEPHCVQLHFRLLKIAFDTLQHLPGHILVIFEICRFLMTPVPLFLSKKDALSKLESCLNEGGTITHVGISLDMCCILRAVKSQGKNF